MRTKVDEDLANNGCSSALSIVRVGSGGEGVGGVEMSMSCSGAARGVAEVNGDGDEGEGG